MTTGAQLTAPDHYDPGYAADPFPLLARLRAERPVSHSDAYGGYWTVTRYEDVREVIQRTGVFSSRYSSVPKDIGLGDFCIPPLHLDPPEHTRFRKLLANAFVPKRVAGYEAATRERVVSLLTSLVDGGQSFDASQDFARIVPTSVVCQLLGCPDMTDTFTGWVQRLLDQATTNPEDAKAAGMELFQFLVTTVGRRRVEPGDDVLSFLTQAEMDGDRLEDHEIVLVAALLVLAGIDTTWGTLATTIHHLATHPDDQRRLREHPELIGSAREEFLRAFASVTIARLVAEDTGFHGCPLRKDEMVLVSLPSANRDEGEFPDAETVHLDRQPNRHLAFGSGIHGCLGANFARMEMTIALQELLRIVPPFRLAEDAEVTWTRGQVRSPKRLVITTT